MVQHNILRCLGVMISRTARVDTKYATIPKDKTDKILAICTTKLCNKLMPKILVNCLSLKQYHRLGLKP